MSIETSMKRPGRKESRNQIKSMVNGLREPMINMTKRQLLAVVKEAKSFTQTNCGWSEYWCKDIIIKFAEDQIKIMAPLKNKKP